MPLFEYQCADCQKEFELLIRGSEEPVCPVCGSKDVDKLISTSALKTVDSGEACGPSCGCCPG